MTQIKADPSLLKLRRDKLGGTAPLSRRSFSGDGRTQDAIVFLRVLLLRVEIWMKRITKDCERASARSRFRVFHYCERGET